MADCHIHGLFNAPRLCHNPMTPMKFLFTLLAVLPQLAVPNAGAQGRHGDQDTAFHGRQSGELRPLREIESGIVPDMRRRGADYIGAEFDGDTVRYRLKFVRDGSVIWVDVDGHTGVVVARAGN